ncbi:MAG: 50S ribosomal protein L23 [Bacteroidetes bacterium]|nr:50S ribosomal protein L23 [Bacteroidota bacterium]
MSILIKPVITEKWTKIAEKQPRYAFLVNPDANKIMIAQAVKELYGVTVESVNTFIQRGKMKSRYTKTGFLSGKRKNVKKAVIILKKGESIDFFSNI